MIALVEQLEEKINKGTDIDELIEEVEEALNEASDNGDIAYSTKEEVSDLLYKIQETYNYDSEDESIATDLESLKSIIEDIER